MYVRAVGLIVNTDFNMKPAISPNRIPATIAKVSKFFFAHIYRRLFKINNFHWKDEIISLFTLISDQFIIQNIDHAHHTLRIEMFNRCHFLITDSGWDWRPT